MMPHVASLGRPESSMATLAGSEQTQEPMKLIMCFDGTGNTFSGSNADTNVVKILNKLGRSDPNQHHYYQTGIGTYDINAHSVDQSWFGELRNSMAQTVDQGFGTTFDAHVMAGYRFLMRYYDSGDKIYMFGFSRGAFTAKFLARMIHTVGLLCKGNEEMVPFAYRLYQRYLAGKVKQQTAGTAAAGMERLLSDEDPLLGEHQLQMARDEVSAFSRTFCRREQVTRDGKKHETNIKVFFLGIWDCVSSVAVLEHKAPIPVPVTGTAHFVRHAVAVDERRVKFKPALLAQDMRSSTCGDEDIKEVWFPGSHGDVGGGWPAAADEPLDAGEQTTLWQRVKNVWTTRKPTAPTRDVGSDPFQMSDIPLAWMIREVELVGERHPSAAVKWSNNVKGFQRRFKQRRDQALGGFMHDSLSFGRGMGCFKVLLWRFMEWFPLITRWELVGNQWLNVRFPLNMGDTRDIPHDAVLHESLVWRLRKDSTYCPRNNHGGRLPPCLKHKGLVVDFEPVAEPKGQTDPDHQTYTFSKSTTNGANTNGRNGG